MNRSLIARSRVALTVFATTLSVVALMHAPTTTAQTAHTLGDSATTAPTSSGASQVGWSVDGGSGDPGSGGTGQSNGHASGGSLCAAPPAQQYGQCASQCGNRGVAAFNAGTCSTAATCTCGPSNPTTAEVIDGALPSAVALPRSADPFAGVVDAGGIVQF